MKNHSSAKQVFLNNCNPLQLSSYQLHSVYFCQYKPKFPSWNRLGILGPTEKKNSHLNYLLCLTPWDRYLLLSPHPQTGPHFQLLIGGQPSAVGFIQTHSKKWSAPQKVKAGWVKKEIQSHVEDTGQENSLSQVIRQVSKREQHWWPPEAQFSALLIETVHFKHFILLL